MKTIKYNGGIHCIQDDCYAPIHVVLYIIISLCISSIRYAGMYMTYWIIFRETGKVHKPNRE
jgi:hypothetical protein